jgi:hypothetical protein
MPIVEARANELVAHPANATLTATATHTHSWAPTERFAWGQATLRNYNEFNNTPPAVAHAFVSDFTAAGTANHGDWAVVSNPKMSEITYKLTAQRCWARAIWVTEFFG